MAAEYSANIEQTVASNAPIIFTESPVPCSRGFIFHQEGSGIFRLSSFGASLPPNICRCTGLMPMAQYLVEFHGNAAISAGGTVEEIQLGIAIDGEIDSSSIMRITPAAVEEYQNIGTSIVVNVPAICRCSSVSVRNISTQDVDVQNANILIDRIVRR